MTEITKYDEADELELVGPRSLKRSGQMRTAMRVYLHEVWKHGDEKVALAKIGRQPKTVWGYKRQSPEWAKEVDEALEYHRSIARGEIAGMLPKAIETFRDNLEQQADLRLANQNAVHVLKNEGILGKEKPHAEDDAPTGVTKITYNYQPTFIRGDDDDD